VEGPEREWKKEKERKGRERIVDGKKEERRSGKRYSFSV
jgi:hypothetical protein